MGEIKTYSLGYKTTLKDSRIGKARKAASAVAPGSYKLSRKKCKFGQGHNNSSKQRKNNDTSAFNVNSTERNISKK